MACRKLTLAPVSCLELRQPLDQELGEGGAEGRDVERDSRKTLGAPLRRCFARQQQPPGQQTGALQDTAAGKITCLEHSALPLLDSGVAGAPRLRNDGSVPELNHTLKSL